MPDTTQTTALNPNEHNHPKLPRQIIELRDAEYRNRALAEGPRAGQVWLLSDAEQSEYAAILAVDEDPRIIIATAMSNDVTLQTDEAMVLNETPMGMPMVIWPELTMKLPARLLDIPCGEFPKDVLHEAVRHHADDTLGISAGKDPEEIWRPALRSLRDRVSLFVTWHKMCDDLPPLQSEQHHEYATDTDLTDYAQALQEILNLNPAECLAVTRGNLQLTETEQRKMADAGFGSMPQKSETIPDEYLIMAEQPEWRFVVDAIGETNGDPHITLARKAAFGLTARTTGHGKEAARGAFQEAARELLGDE